MADAPMAYYARKRPDWMLLFALAAVPLLAELAGLISEDYGCFIDEFYYVAATG
jgi:hypothetical protein